jgi:hypothetical protein
MKTFSWFYLVLTDKCGDRTAFKPLLFLSTLYSLATDSVLKQKIENKKEIKISGWVKNLIRLDRDAPYAPAALYSQQDSWYSFLLEAESTPAP